MPTIDAANIAYSLLKTVAKGGIAIGPILLGAEMSAQVLTPSTAVRRIVHMTAFTVSKAAARKRCQADLLVRRSTQR